MSVAVSQALLVAIDAALDLRVALHQERNQKLIAVPEYLAGLKAVREVERVLEPLRGAEHSRAYELALAQAEHKEGTVVCAEP